MQRVIGIDIDDTDDARIDIPLEIAVQAINKDGFEVTQILVGKKVLAGTRYALLCKKVN